MTTVNILDTCTLAHSYTRTHTHPRYVPPSDWTLPQWRETSVLESKSGQVGRQVMCSGLRREAEYWSVEYTILPAVQRHPKKSQFRTLLVLSPMICPVFARHVGRSRNHSGFVWKIRYPCHFKKSDLKHASKVIMPLCTTLTTFSPPRAIADYGKMNITKKH
jgi:hypothetical protein